MKKSGPKSSKSKSTDSNNGYQDEEIKAVANLPDCVGTSKKDKEEEQYQIKKPQIQGLIPPSTNNKPNQTLAPTATKQSDVHDPDQFMREVRMIHY